MPNEPAKHDSDPSEKEAAEQPKSQKFIIRTIDPHQLTPVTLGCVIAEDKDHAVEFAREKFMFRGKPIPEEADLSAQAWTDATTADRVGCDDFPVFEATTESKPKMASAKPEKSEAKHKDKDKDTKHHDS